MLVIQQTLIDIYVCKFNVWSVEVLRRKKLSAAAKTAVGLTIMRIYAMEQNVPFVNEGIIKDILREIQIEFRDRLESRK